MVTKKRNFIGSLFFPLDIVQEGEVERDYCLYREKQWKKRFQIPLIKKDTDSSTDSFFPCMVTFSD